MIDGLCLARGRRSLGQILPAYQHIDERRLAHIRAPNKGKLGQACGRTLVDIGITDYKLCFPDDHLM